MTKIINWMGKERKNSFLVQNFFTIAWGCIHALAIAILVVAAIISLCSFGMGIGLSPPVDVHVPNAEELEGMIKEERENNGYHSPIDQWERENWYSGNDNNSGSNNDPDDSWDSMHDD